MAKAAPGKAGGAGRGAAAGAKGGRRRARRGPAKPWVKVMVLVLLFPFAAVLLPTTLVFATMMAPTLVAYATDRSPDKHLAITVGLMNFAGTLPAIVSLWTRGQSHPAAMDLISDVFVWAVAYGAAFTGWAIFGFMPSVVASYYRMTTKTRVRALLRRQKALIDEWGHAVADGAPLPPLDDDEEEGDGEVAEQAEAGDVEMVPPGRRRAG